MHLNKGFMHQLKQLERQEIVPQVLLLTGQNGLLIVVVRLVMLMIQLFPAVMHQLIQEELLFHQVVLEEKNKFLFHLINTSIAQHTTLQEYTQILIERDIIPQLIIHQELSHIIIIMNLQGLFIMHQLQYFVIILQLIIRQELSHIITIMNLQGLYIMSQLEYFIINHPIEALDTLHSLYTLSQHMLNLYIPNQCIQCTEDKLFMLNLYTLSQHTVINLFMLNLYRLIQHMVSQHMLSQHTVTTLINLFFPLIKAIDHFIE
jgi:hypothetical protein